MKKSLFSILLAFLAIGLGMFKANATELGVIEFGKVYSLKAYDSLIATIVAPSTGTLFQDGGDIFSYVESESGKSITPTNAGYGDHGQVWSIKVEQGKTYNLACDFVMNASQVVWKMSGSEPLKLVNVDPKAGSVISTSTNSTGDILITFNEPATYTSASLSAGSKTVQISVDDIPGRRSAQLTQAVRISNALRQLYADKSISADGGDALVLNVEGVSSINGAKYGTDGTLSLNYVAAPKPMEMVSSTYGMTGGKFLSYYPEGTPQGIITCVFSDQIDPAHKPYAEFTIGDVSNPNGHVVEEIPVFVSGNTITVNLTGVNRRPAIAAVGIKSGEYCGVKISNIFDSRHNPAEGNGQGLLASVEFSFTYEEVPERPITYQFTPETGSFLARENTIELWMDNFDVIQKFDGILFNYDDGDSYLIPRSQLVNVSEEPGEAVFQIAIPDKAKTTPVNVSLANIVSNDGYDKIITASYNKFVVTYSTPFVEGATLDIIEADPFLVNDDATISDELIHIRTNFSDLFPQLFIWYKVYDATLDRYVHGSYMTNIGEGEFVGAWLPYDYRLVAGHTYTATFYAWDSEAAGYPDIETCQYSIGSHTITFFGSGSGFMYSSTVFESITPDPNMGPITPDQNVITVTYDGLVKINEEKSGIPLGMGMGLTHFEKVEAVNPDPENDGFASSWQLTIPASVLSRTDFEVSVAAYDVYNLTVQGDMETYDDNDYKSFSFTVKSASSILPIVVVPSDGSHVESISTLSISNESYPISINWNCTEPIVIYDRLGEVHTVVKSDGDDNEVILIAGEDESTLSSINIVLQTPITEEGAYFISIPEGYFVLGDQFETYNSEETSVTLFIGGSTDIDLGVTPMDGDVVDEISTIWIWTNASLNPDCEDVITLDNDNSKAMFYHLEEWSTFYGVEPLMSLDDDPVVIGYVLNCLNNSSYTESGDYTIHIPAGFFIENGVMNAERTINFSIGGFSEGGELVLNISPNPLDNPDSISEITISSEDGIAANYNDTVVTISKRENESDNWADQLVATASDFDPWTENGYFVNDKEVCIKLPEAIDLNKNYVRLHIPAGFFRDEWSTKQNNEVEIVYAKVSGISSVLSENGDRTFTVYTINGVKVLSTTDLNQLKSLAPGFYVINGKKYILK